MYDSFRRLKAFATGFLQSRTWRTLRMILSLAIVSFVLAVIPAAMFLANLPLFLFPRPNDESSPTESVSVLIPARDEEAGIEACVRSCLTSATIDLEVVVLDDQSQDATANIVKMLSEEDARVRLIPESRCRTDGTANSTPASNSQTPRALTFCCFLDADVRLEAHALPQLLRRHRDSEVELLSAFPMQETGHGLNAG